MNQNVLLTYIWTWCETFSATLRSGDVLSAYILLRWKSRSLVGFIQGINGVVQMVIAFVSGAMADHTRRDSAIRVASVIGAVSFVLMTATLALSWPVWSMALAMGLMGTYRGFNNPPIESIFADSVPMARRASPFTTKFVIQNAASAAGPLINVGIFCMLGNEWTLPNCRDVLLIGLVTMLPPLLIMCFFDDDLSLGLSSEAISVAPSTASVISSMFPRALRTRTLCSCLGGAADEQVLVPMLISVSDFFGAFASGMTIKFFPLFFIEQCGLDPMAQQLLSALSPLCISFASVLASAASQSVGRVPVAMTTRILDVALLVLMAYYPVGDRRLLPALLAIHLMRSASANCARPLMRSVMMEFVPKRDRAKWAAADSVRTFSWSGSAALGGVLIEFYGYQTTFLVTAGVKLLAWLPLWLLLFIVPDSPCWSPPGLQVIPETTHGDFLISERGDDDVDDGDGDSDGDGLIGASAVDDFDETYDDRDPGLIAVSGDLDGLLAREVRVEDCYPPRRKDKAKGDGPFTMDREEM